MNDKNESQNTPEITLDAEQPEQEGLTGIDAVHHQIIGFADSLHKELERMASRPMAFVLVIYDPEEKKIIPFANVEDGVAIQILQAAEKNYSLVQMAKENTNKDQADSEGTEPSSSAGETVN